MAPAYQARPFLQLHSSLNFEISKILISQGNDAKALPTRHVEMNKKVDEGGGKKKTKNLLSALNFAFEIFPKFLRTLRSKR